MKPKIAILIPCYNEDNTISEVGDSIRRSGYDYLIVNDGSTDKTSYLLKINSLKHIEYTHNKGKGYAIKYGAKYLITKGYGYIVVMDSDGQNDLKDIGSFYTALKLHPDAKIIIGNRFHNARTMPAVRYYTNRCMSWLISKLANKSISDTQCGMRLAHKDVFDLETKSRNFEYESEQLIKAGRKGFKIISIPITCIYNKERVSKMRPIKDTIRFFKMIIKLS